MSSIEEVREARLKKLKLLTEAGIDPYPSESHHTHTGEEFIANQQNFIANNEVVTLGGRVVSIRDQGGSVFVDLFDGTQKVQTYFKKDSMDEKVFEQFGTFVDMGDFIEVTGTAFITKRGAPSLQASEWRMLAKSLRPIPDEWFGIKDEDERFRKRYLDMIGNAEVADLVRKRSVFWNAIRSFMLNRGFLEVETPILETRKSGARAKQFITHHNALNIDVYLRISPELWHKRLILGGIPKIFEIGRVFRNEGISYEHAQDYTVLEFYEAYQDAEKGIPMTIDLCRHAAKETFGTLDFLINGFNVNLEKDWQILNFNDLIKQHYKIDLQNTSLDEVKKVLDTKEIKYESGTTDLKHCVDLLWTRIRETIGGPVILTGTPYYLAPLGKRSKENPFIMDEFKILLGGNEIGHSFNELNDPRDQLLRLKQQQEIKKTAIQFDIDSEYVEALEYGMPPTFGVGISERFFSFLTNTSIRNSQIFPLMKPKPVED